MYSAMYLPARYAVRIARYILLHSEKAPRAHATGPIDPTVYTYLYALTTGQEALHAHHIIPYHKHATHQALSTR